MASAIAERAEENFLLKAYGPDPRKRCRLRFWQGDLVA